MSYIPAWNAWYHCTVHTYGSWLPGDPRGWRSRDHREHCEGDYRHPPAKGAFDELHKRSKALMKRQPVTLTVEQRRLVLAWFIERLLLERVEVIAGSQDDHHLHLLGRFADYNARHLLGLSKKHSSHEFRRQWPTMPAGGIWAVGSQAKPIRDREHQVNVVHYILEHEQRGACVYRSFGSKKQ